MEKGLRKPKLTPTKVVGSKIKRKVMVKKSEPMGIVIKGNSKME